MPGTRLSASKEDAADADNGGPDAARGADPPSDRPLPLSMRSTVAARSLCTRVCYWECVCGWVCFVCCCRCCASFLASFLSVSLSVCFLLSLLCSSLFASCLSVCCCCCMSLYLFLSPICLFLCRCVSGVCGRSLNVFSMYVCMCLCGATFVCLSLSVSPCLSLLCLRYLPHSCNRSFLAPLSPSPLHQIRALPPRPSSLPASSCV